jgi:deoxyadenosine/deoxycytidine kinase
MIEGVSGAGKSTLCRVLDAQIPNVCIIPEPFDRWNNVQNGGNLFETFLNDKSRWGLTFQNYVFITHYQALHDAYASNPNKEIYITDRSHFSGMFTFTRMLFDTNNITPLEWAIYQESASWLTEQLPEKPDGFIYLQTKPATACARAIKRNRELNASLNLPFYETLHRYHEEWLIEKKNLPASVQQIPILVLDGEVDFEHNPEAQRVIIEKVRDFIESLTSQWMHACL